MSNTPCCNVSVFRQFNNLHSFLSFFVLDLSLGTIFEFGSRAYKFLYLREYVNLVHVINTMLKVIKIKFYFFYKFNPYVLYVNFEFSNVRFACYLSVIEDLKLTIHKIK